MRLELVGFSQEASVSDPENIKYFFLIRLQTGRTIKLSVLKETTEDLIKAIYSENEEELGPSLVDEEVEEGISQVEEDPIPSI